jgi:uncharacterized protein YxjI
MKTITITQINTVYHIQMHSGKIHCLNRKSLIWNLKNTFNLKGQDGRLIMKNLDENGRVEIYTEVA